VIKDLTWCLAADKAVQYSVVDLQGLAADFEISENRNSAKKERTIFQVLVP